MSLTSEKYKEEFACTGGVAYNVTDFRIWASEDEEVVHVTTAGVETTLTPTTSYAISNIASTGFTVTTVQSYSSGTLVVRRNQPKTQEADWERNGPLSTPVLEEQLDKLVAMIQSNAELLARTILQTATADSVLAFPVASASALIGWNSAGTALENTNNPAVAAAASAAAASLSETAAELAETHAETAETNAETAETNAEAAQVVAQSAANSLGVNANTYSTIDLAVAGIGTTETTLIVTESQALSASLIIPSTLALRVEKGGTIVTASGKNLTVNGPFQAGLYQTFSGAGLVRWGSGSVTTVYPEWWGAVGDNSTQCLTAIQAAIDSMPAFSGVDNSPFNGVDNGGTVQLSKGDYVVDASIVLDSHQRLVGVGRGTVIVNSGAGTPIVTMGNASASSHGIYLADMLLEGATAGFVSGEYGVHVIQGRRSVISNVSVQGCSDDGIYVQGASYFYITGGGYINANQNRGIYVVNTTASGFHATAVYISNYTIRGNVKGGVEFKAVPDSRIHNCTIESNGSTGQKIGTNENAEDLNMNLYLNGCTGVIVQDCYFETSGAYTDRLTEIAFNGGYWNRVEGCSFNTASASGLYLYSGDSVVSLNKFIRNSFPTSYDNVYTCHHASKNPPSNNIFIENYGMRWVDEETVYNENDVTNGAFSDGQRLTVITVSGGSSYTPDCGYYNLNATHTGRPKGRLYVITLDENMTINLPSPGAAIGSDLNFMFIQGSSGGLNVSWNAQYRQAWSDTGNTVGNISTIAFKRSSSANYNQMGAQSPYYANS